MRARAAGIQPVASLGRVARRTLIQTAPSAAAAESSTSRRTGPPPQPARVLRTRSAKVAFGELRTGAGATRCATYARAKVGAGYGPAAGAAGARVPRAA